jgi:20S proteasome subunit beta 6
MSRWSPYVDNGGTALAIAGDTYAIIAADRRVSSGYQIQTRQCPKISQLTKSTVLASCGMQSDRHALHSILKARMQVYELNNEKEMSLHAISQMLSRTLYYRRFFPYYTFNLLAGVSPKGEGFVYSYDAIGSFEAEKHTVTGSGADLAMPLLDNIMKKQHQSKADKNIKPTKDEALQLVKNVLNAVTERDIHTGDGADIYIITKDGIEHQHFELRED